MSYKILLVDDELNSLKVLSAALTGENIQVDTAASGEEAYEMFKKEPYDLVISDYKMPGMNGEELLEKVKTITPEIPFILLTAFGTIELAVDAMRKGAYTYLAKPVNLDLMESVVGDILFQGEQDEDDETPGRYQFLNIIGKTKPMQDIFSLIRRVAKTDANILILGESGTGKELVARALHYSSLRSDKPFIPIDCTTIPAELMESELFGYEKGAFSGATDRKIGLIEMAQGGTIFLDEIGDLDYALEKKLLRFLQEREIRRVGGKERIKVDVRVISATNRDIEKDVDSGEFRGDLYYRLNVITINMPPLRERKGDIPLLADCIFKRLGCAERCSLSDEALEALRAYSFPGNVRELHNMLERASLLSDNGRIGLQHLPLNDNQHVAGACTMPIPLDSDGVLPLEEIENRYIQWLNSRFMGSRADLAERLGISERTLYRRLQEH